MTRTNKDAQGQIWSIIRRMFPDAATEFARQDRYEMASAIADKFGRDVVAAIEAAGYIVTLDPRRVLGDQRKGVHFSPTDAP